MTSAAISDLNNISKQSYDGIYTIDSSASDTGAKPYGTAVDYTITVKLKNPLSNVRSDYGSAIISGTRTGTAVTQVRQPDAD